MNININPLNPCPICGGEENRGNTEEGKYKFYCERCGQTFELDAPSQKIADMIYNSVIARK